MEAGHHQLVSLGQGDDYIIFGPLPNAVFDPLWKLVYPHDSNVPQCGFEQNYFLMVFISF